jgi:acyl-CoA synthetase (AMP-forming)/AMP-acid ligase II
MGTEHVGEIRVSSASLADGYLGQRDLTAERFTSDAVLTGDIGFVLDDELFVTGRLDDLITIAGRNVYARDIEAALGSVGGIRPGMCAVIPLESDNGTRIVAVMEPLADHGDLTVLARRTSDAARRAAGVRIAECVFLPEGAFPKTPSGKVRRFRSAELAADCTIAGGKRIVL